VVWGEYDAVLRTAVLAMKRRGRDELARPLGRRLAGRISLEWWAPQVDAVTHVPSHPLRRLRHGPSAAAELAVVLAKQLDRPHVRALRRRGFHRQAGRSRAQRLLLPRQSFRCIASIQGKRLLVVDDVTTTGATLRRTTEILLSAGAEGVYCAALARTPDTRRPT
jgi:predicted amidophosphoribosyltransferase